MHIERAIAPFTRMWRMPFLAALLAVSGATSGSPPHGTTTLVYDLSRSGFALAEMTDTLHTDALSYQLVSNAQGVGLVALLARGQTLRRESRGAIGAEGLVPRSFIEQRGANYRLSAEFDWPAREVVLTNAQGEVSREPLAAKAQDRLSMAYQIAFLRNRPPPTEFSVQVADGRFLSDYTLRLVGTETIATGFGEVKALHYTKVLSGNDTAFDLWLGIEHQLLPVRVSYADKDGARFEQSLRSIQPARL
ncbi:MAG: DUF3108 domain-containing protein [Betaproteobacteria bacterium]